MRKWKLRRPKGKENGSSVKRGKKEVTVDDMGWGRKKEDGGVH